MKELSITGGGINSLLSKGVVKSVQRGAAYSQSIEKYGSKEYNISNIDVSKAVLIANIFFEDSGNDAGMKHKTTITLNNTSIRIDNYDRDYSVNFSIFWQVIEFY